MLPTALWPVWYVLATVALAAFAFLCWTNRNVRGVQYLLAATLVGSVQSLCYALVLFVPVLPTKVILWKLFTVLSVFVLFCWYLFVATWTGRDALARGWPAAVVGLPLLGLAALIATNDSPAVSGLHALYWTDVDVADGTASAATLAFEHGPLALGHGLVAVGLVCATLAAIARFTLRPEQRLYRWRNSMILLGGATGLLFGVGFASLSVPFQPQPFAYVLGSGFVVLGVVRFGIYDVVSLPENSLIEAIEGGILVYSVDGSVIDTNQAAQHVLGLPDDVAGMGIVGVVETAAELPTIRASGDAEGSGPGADPAAVAEHLDGHEFTTSLNRASRRFVVRVSELTDDDGNLLGWTVLCYDVTDLRQKQQELDLLKQVLSRVLRHNVRNDLSVVKANANMLAEQTSGLEAERLQTIIDRSDNLLDASEKARTVEQLLDGKRTRSEFDIATVTRDAIESVAREFPNVSFETAIPEACRVRAHWAVSHAVENVVENAAMHNDAADPTVRVEIEPDDRLVTLTVADNGPGIPYQELEVLERREETQLEHGSSVGLWLVAWILDLSRGEITFENTDRGCTVTLELERAVPETEQEGEDTAGELDFGIGAADD